ncbi:10865_t:CDS:1, partial [Scutellospora calospora]
TAESVLLEAVCLVEIIADSKILFFEVEVEVFVTLAGEVVPAAEIFFGEAVGTELL